MQDEYRVWSGPDTGVVDGEHGVRVARALRWGQQVGRTLVNRISMQFVT